MKYWIWLSRLKGVGPIIQKRLLERFCNPESVFNADRYSLLKVEGIGESTAENIVSSKSLDDSMRILDNLNKIDGRVLTLNDDLYPKGAASMIYSPVVLYYKGEIKSNLDGIGIVGSRRCSQYGKRVALEAGQWFGKYGYAVISGMAKGIDGYAHTGCLKASGYTIAFLGTGIDICYPKEHIGLMKRIIENGAVVSEYPPGTTGRPEFFPRRNYHISSWSKKLLVVEASEKSGALITADIAKRQGRDVFAAPSQIYSKTGFGTNMLINNGAKLYTDPKCIVGSDEKKYSEQLIKKIETEEKKDITEIERKILDIIGDSKLAVNEISKLVEINQVELSQHLAELELKGSLNCISGRYECA